MSQMIRPGVSIYQNLFSTLQVSQVVIQQEFIAIVINGYLFAGEIVASLPLVTKCVCQRTCNALCIRGSLLFFSIAAMYCYLKFKLRYLKKKNLNLFSIRVKELQGLPCRFWNY